MAKQVLPTDFKDDILNKSMRGQRRYTEVSNTDGTLSLVDASNYDQVGSAFGAAQINATNAAVNESADKNTIIDKLSDVAANTTSGKIAGALALKELNNNLGNVVFTTEGSGENTKYYVQKGADTASKKQLGKSNVIFKSGPGPWDFSREFPGGVGFDINNCHAIINGYDVITFVKYSTCDNTEYVPKNSTISKCAGTFDNVSLNVKNLAFSLTSWQNGAGTIAYLYKSGGAIDVLGCIYIIPGD